MKDYTLSYKGTSLHYRIGGKGGTLLLLHGFTETQDIWNDFSSELSQEYRVVTVDLPGHGESGCIGEVHTMELMAECVKSVLDDAGITNCVMIGHSMGGYVTLSFAGKYPEMLKGLGLFHSSALADTDEAKVNRTKVIEFIRMNHTSFITTFIPDLFAPQNRECFKKEIEELVQAAKKMPPHSIIAAQEGMKDRTDRTDILKQATFPVLFIAGKLDSRIPFDKLMQQAALPDDAVILSMGDVAHMGYIESRDKTLFAVKCFLQGIYNK